MEFTEAAALELEQQGKRFLTLTVPIIQEWDPEVSNRVARWIDESGQWLKQVDDLFGPEAKRLHAAHKRITSWREKLKEPVETLAKRVNRAIADRIAKLEREAEEERRLVAAEVQKQAEADRLDQAEAMAEAGIDPESVDRFLEEPLDVAPVAKLEIARVAGTAVKNVWKAEVTDLAELLRYVADHPEYYSLVTISAAGLNRVAAQQQGACVLKGVTVWSEKSVSRTGR